jgi:hypothetical protein
MKLFRIIFFVWVGLVMIVCFADQSKVYSAEDYVISASEVNYTMETVNENGAVAQDENVDVYQDETGGVPEDIEQETLAPQSVVGTEGAVDVYKPSESVGDPK